MNSRDVITLVSLFTDVRRRKIRTSVYNGIMRYWFAGAFVLGAALLFAQDWKTATTLPKVDLEGLSAAKRATALRMLRNHDCSCGCGMKVAQCRVEDPNCGYSRG